MCRYFKRIVGIGSVSYIYYWKSKGLSDRTINSITASNYNVTSQLSYYGTKPRVEFNGSCLEQDIVTFDHGKIVNIYIFYDISKSIDINNYPALENCLFGVVKLTKHVDVDQYKYSGYGIEFDRKGSYSIGIEAGRNVIIFGVDMNSSAHIDNKKKDTLILGKGTTQRLVHRLTAEKLYSVNFTKENTKCCLSLHYNGENSYLFVNGTEIIEFKAKDSETTAYPLCLENISKDWSIDNMKKIGLKRYVYDFSVDYDAVAVFDIDKYLMNKNEIV